MKRWLTVLLLLFTLAGCTQESNEMDRVLALREKLAKGNGCSFDAIITADYGEDIYTFTLSCKTTNGGLLNFTVTDPDSISGISGSISESKGEITFDGKALAFDILAEDLISPVSAPWHFIRSLNGGYISSCGKDGQYLKVIINDSYEEETLKLDLWLDEMDHPVRAEFLWQGRRVLSVDVRNFAFL